jgi:glycolate dehydrogenase FAD-binding subunit
MAHNDGSSPPQSGGEEQGATMTTFTPTTATEILSTVQWAAAEETPLEILGHGSKRGIGRPLQTEHTLDLSKLTGVTLYEPAELVLSARAGTPLAEIEKLLSENGQQLAFEPMDYGPLLGGMPGKGTIGGVLAANLSGPRRLKAGAARDHILGISAVAGRGEAFKSGGRVVKNVTGYDLSKLMANSWGTLAVLTDVTFKVLPAAETEVTLAIRGLLDDAAAAAMALALGSSAEVSSAAHLPERVAARVAAGHLGSDAATLLRVEGFGPSVVYRVTALKDLLGKAGPLQEIAGEASKTIWRDVRDCAPFADGSEKPVWRVSMAPSQAHQMVLTLRMQAAVSAFYDWQGGLVWLRMEEGDPEAGPLRGLIRRHGGGHATLVRAAPSHRAAVPVFEPQAPHLAALSARLKAEFDPKTILNPGRMAPGSASATLTPTTEGAAP